MVGRPEDEASLISLAEGLLPSPQTSSTSSLVDLYSLIILSLFPLLADL